MPHRKGNGRQRQLGRRLRRMRENAGLTIEAAAIGLEFSTSKLSRIENADQGVDIHTVKSMLDLYDIGGDRWDETLQLTRDAKEKPWYAGYLALGDYGYVGYEADADQVQDWAPNYVPGLLQTADYARAMFLSEVIERTPARVTTSVKVRVLRQRRLTDHEHPLRLVAITSENALRTPFGDPAMMRAQIAHLIAASELASVTLQVVPAHTAPHASLSSGFAVLSFGNLGEPDLAYVEHSLGANFLERADDVLLARLKFDQLRTMALTPAATLELLREIAAAM
ncbi:helix-turn-helix domain-containing protein [Pseudonocardia sp. CA-107938]|uniref:helix-turn-helix domain-containing protein n=1 Tax=Pseudonocardia sp. CA-107938 TaxID=3240021 RepID=UPI003D8A1DD3